MRPSCDPVLQEIRSRLKGIDIINRYAGNPKDIIKIGDNYKLKCFLPGHKDDTPSLSISRDKFVYNCFGGCQGDRSKGDFFTLIQIMENCNFNQAKKIAANIVGVEIKSKPKKKEKFKPTFLSFDKVPDVIPDIPDKIATEFHENLISNGNSLQSFLKRRGLEISSVYEYKLGMDQHGNYTIPIYEDGKLVNIKYRSYGNSNKRKYWSYSIKCKDGGKINYGSQRLFNIDLIKRYMEHKIIFCAGEYDAISITDLNSGIIGVCSTTGEGTWLEGGEWDNLLLSREVIICMDNDDAGAKAAMKISKIMPNALISSIPESLGPKSDICDLVKKVGKKEAIKIILDRSATFDHNTDIVPEDIERLNPAYHITRSGRVYLACMVKRTRVYAPEKKRNSKIAPDPITYEAIEPVIVTSDRDMYDIPKVDPKLKKVDPNAVSTIAGMALTHEPITAQEKWSGPWMMRFLNGHKCFSDIKSAYMSVFNAVNSYSVLSRKTYSGLISLYIVGSYFYEVFPSFPYLHLHGVKGSGKSTLARVIEAMSFNGIFMVNPTLAVLARRIQETKGLVVIDEAEQNSTRKDGRSPISQILNSGYQRGAIRPICDTENGNKIQTFDLYCPKVICNIHDLNDTTKSRCITISTKRAENFVCKKDPESDDSLKGISRKMYEVLMSKAKSVISAYSEVKAMNSFSPIRKNISSLSVGGRTRELFIPLLTMAMFIYKESGYDKPWDNIIKELHIINDEKNIDESLTPEELLREAAVGLLTKAKTEAMEITAFELGEEYKKMSTDQKNGLERWVSTNLKSLGLADVKRFTPSRRNVICRMREYNGDITKTQKRLMVYTITYKSLRMNPPDSYMAGRTRVTTIDSEREHLEVAKKLSDAIKITNINLEESLDKPSAERKELPF